MAGNVVDGAKGVAGTVADKVGDVAEGAKDMAGNVVEGAKDAAGTVADKAGDVVEGAKDIASDAVDKVVGDGDGKA